MKTKYTRKSFNAAHQVCFANLRTLRGKPRGVLTRIISAKIKKECRLHSSLVLVEIRGSFARTTNADPTGDKDTNKVYSQRLNAAHQVCFANLRTLRDKPRGVLTRVISAKIKKECRLHSSLVLVEIRGFEPLTYALRTHRSTN